MCNTLSMFYVSLSSIWMPEGFLEGLYYFRNGIYYFVLARKTGIHFILQVIEAGLEIIKAFIMELLIKNTLPSLNLRWELSSESVYFCSSFIFRFLSSFSSLSCSFKTKRLSLILPIFSFSLLILASFSLSSPSLSSIIKDIENLQFFRGPPSFPSHAEGSYLSFSHLGFSSVLEFISSFG